VQAQDILPLPSTEGNNAWTLPPLSRTPSLSAEREVYFAKSVFGLKILNLQRQVASSVNFFDPAAFKKFELTKGVRTEF
jgi:hypothetical protein